MKRITIDDSAFSTRMRDLGSGRTGGLMIRGTHLFTFTVSLLVLLTLAGCGRYEPPFAPEDLAPSRLTEVSVRPTVEAVHFAWQAPTKDQRGKELRSIDGYRVVRKSLETEADLLSTSVPFELVGEVEDLHLRDLDARREEARAQGKPTRRITANASLSAFTFVDSTVEPGQRYAYQILPVNQGGVEGKASNMVVVLFQGERSEIRTVQAADVSEVLF